VNQARLDYQAAEAELEAALVAREASLERYESALQAVQGARETGGNAEEDAAQARFLTISQELTQQDVRVEELEDRVEDAADAYLAALDRRRDELESELALTATAAEANQIRDLLVDIQYQARSLQTRLTRLDGSQTTLFSSLSSDPRDGPLELRTKAEILERKAEEVDSLLADISRRVQRLEAELRLERMEGDFSAGIDRFDDRRLPVGPGRQTAEDEPVVPADSAAALESLPPAQQIESLRRSQERLVILRQEMLDRAAAFRERLERITE
jgi:hypothetical protein